MKKGKRYTEAAKLVDRATTYDAAEAVSIVKKSASASLMRPSSAIFVLALMAVMQISRFVVQLYFLMEQVRLYVFWYLLRVLRLTRHRQQVQISLVARN